MYVKLASALGRATCSYCLVQNYYYYFCYYYYYYHHHHYHHHYHLYAGWCRYLRHCATSRKIARSNPDGVTD
jgi:hypothetical protein